MPEAADVGATGFYDQQIVPEQERVHPTVIVRWDERRKKIGFGMRNSSPFLNPKPQDELISSQRLLDLNTENLVVFFSTEPVIGSQTPQDNRDKYESYVVPIIGVDKKPTQLEITKGDIVNMFWKPPASGPIFIDTPFYSGLHLPASEEGSMPEKLILFASKTEPSTDEKTLITTTSHDVLYQSVKNMLAGLSSDLTEERKTSNVFPSTVQSQVSIIHRLIDETAYEQITNQKDALNTVKNRLDTLAGHNYLYANLVRLRILSLSYNFLKVAR